MSTRKAFYFARNIRDAIGVDGKMCLCEVVLKNTSRPFVDFDADVHEHIEMIDDALQRYFFETFNVCVTSRWKYSKDDDDGSNRRWHCIVSGVYFDGCWEEQCRSMCDYLDKRLSSLFIDRSVYRAHSTLRLVGQCKQVNGRFTRRLLPHSCAHPLLQLSIAPDEQDVRMSLGACERSVASSVAATTFATSRDIVHRRVQVPNGYAMSKPLQLSDGCVLYRLARVHPSMCVICKRVHHKENGAVIVRGSFLHYMCFRAIDNNGVYVKRSVYVTGAFDGSVPYALSFFE
jgi:hypothetical protein